MKLNVYSPAGRLVRRLVDGERQGPGRFAIPWDGRDETGQGLSSGLYFCRLEAEQATDVKKLTLIQ